MIIQKIIFLNFLINSSLIFTMNQDWQQRQAEQARQEQQKRDEMARHSLYMAQMAGSRSNTTTVGLSSGVNTQIHTYNANTTGKK